MTADSWVPAEPDVAAILARDPHPLDALAEATTPALILRQAYPPQQCAQLVQRLIDQQLLYDPALPVPDKFVEESIPEGYYREGRSAQARQAWREQTATGRRRIDIGTSLGYRGSDRAAFFQHADQTRALFRSLFSPDDDPVAVCYSSLQQLAAGRTVRTACEPDGQEYGPAIIRAHYGGYTYRPHFDSVRLRERRDDYAVYHFAHQFAGVLVLQNSTLEGRAAQARIHRCLWTPEVDPHLREGTFHEYATQRQLDSIEVHLQPGDLYFFNTRCIHEVPGVEGDLPRIVLATFIGYDPSRPELFVWS